MTQTQARNMLLHSIRVLGFDTAPRFVILSSRLPITADNSNTPPQMAQP